MLNAFVPPHQLAYDQLIVSAYNGVYSQMLRPAPSVLLEAWRGQKRRSAIAWRTGYGVA